MSFGVVPFENSTNGSVVYTLDLFADRQAQYSDVYVCGEAYLHVHHCLLGHATNKHSQNGSLSGEATPTYQTPAPMKPRSQPLKDIRHIKRVYSHAQAFGQCEAFLATYLKGVERQEVSSTSKAAELVSQDNMGFAAAISSRVAAQVHGLDVLAKGIEDRDDNTTRFFFLHHGPATADFLYPDTLHNGHDGSSWKTLVAFTIDQSLAGALADALMVFKTYSLNLTSINSRPSRISPWHYIFFVEFEGQKVANGGQVNKALTDLAACTKDCRWYGSWRTRTTK